MDTKEAGGVRPRRPSLFCDGTNNTLVDRGHQRPQAVRLPAQLAAGHRLAVLRPCGRRPARRLPAAHRLIDLIKRRWARIAGLASGQGVYDNIGEGYRFLSATSTSASTTASSASASRGRVHGARDRRHNLFGILRPEHEELIPTLVRIYFLAAADRGGAGRGPPNWRRSLARFVHRVGSPDRARKARAAPRAGEEADRGHAQPGSRSRSGATSRGPRTSSGSASGTPSNRSAAPSARATTRHGDLRGQAALSTSPRAGVRRAPLALPAAGL